jgi:uncharacterized membrane protein YkvA (DUF1232 family)
MVFLARLQQLVRDLRSQTYALYLAARDPRTPWYAKLLVAGIVAYALSPIDLIPDFIPVLGYLDDFVLIPLGIAFVIQLIPDAVWAESRARAEQSLMRGVPASRVAAMVIVLIWLVLAVLGMVWAYQAFITPA